MTEPTASIAGDLLIGAGEIAKFIYGNDGEKAVRDVYRNVFGFSLFKHGNSVAALKSTIHAELAEMQQAARKQRQHPQKLQPAPQPKRRRRIADEAAA